MASNRLFPAAPSDEVNRLVQGGAPYDASGAGTAWSNLSDWVAAQRAQSAAMGLMDPSTGLPTRAGIADAASQYANGLLLGTTAPGGNALRAFHGSPHDFDQFSLGAIGTGEGAQAYGHGLYFAENEGVARSYRDALADTSVGGVPLSQLNVPEQAKQVISLIGRAPGINTMQDAATMLRKDGTRYAQTAAASQGVDGVPQAVVQRMGDLAKAHTDGADWLEQNAHLPVQKNPGRMYEVNLNVQPHELLDWDKPLSEQHPQLREALQAHAELGGRQNWDDRATGQQVYKQIAETPDASASMLNFMGVKGIKYLDGGSRGSGAGTSNYVMFDPATIEILRKYGLAGLGLGTAATAAGAPNDAP